VRTLVHLSDLHFGRVDDAVVDALTREVVRIAPHVVAISGDFTQRARRVQFRQARAFLDTLPRPQVVVPGNHDVPLFNVAARFLNPLGGYRRHITSDLRPYHADAELIVVGTDTTRSLTAGGGGLRCAEVSRIRELLRGAGGSAARVLVAHHPFDTPPPRAPLVRKRRGVDALEELARDGVDVFLTGHLHVSYAGHTAARYNVGGRSAIVVEAGTATSNRLRGEANAFNVLRIEPDAIVVER
jgi:3',5'-cyclic AMP phosphodiesterase CpdA